MSYYDVIKRRSEMNEQYNPQDVAIDNVVKTDELNHVHLNGYEFYEIENVSNGVTTYPWVIVKNDEYIMDVDSCVDAINFCLGKNA